MRPIRPRAGTALIFAALAFAGLAAGCGGKSEEEKARENLRAWLNAAVKGDAKRYCELLAEESRRTVERRGDCATIVKQQFETPGGRLLRGVVEVLAKSKKTSVSVDGDTARARITVTGLGSQERTVTLQMRKEDGEWRVLTARPQAGLGSGSSSSKR
ncbi:nuclear transport factor 2 family protein [Thermoleophilum album]|uniref:DUF4878 domain-containing protein n=1 Tax=Thermoleophilum album TaxID=29539 RepID=A0A1H6FW93_THEAL|nr:nuclear transport factor 2 family protein [Thermoleophilum album]SEH15059.1 hypothetical protein SAMN02745716_1829 [Thermoleophilum album]